MELTVVVVGATVVVVELVPSSLLSLLPPQAAKRIINIPSKIKPIILFIVVVSLRLQVHPISATNVDMIMQKSNNFDKKRYFYIGNASISQLILVSYCYYLDIIRITERMFISAFF